MLSALNAQLEKCPSREDLPETSSAGASSHFRKGSFGRNAGFWEGHSLTSSADEPFEYRDGYGFTRVENSHAFTSTTQAAQAHKRDRSGTFGFSASANAALGLKRRSSEVALGAARKAIDATKKSMRMLRKRESGTWEETDPETGLKVRITRRSNSNSNSNSNSRKGSFSQSEFSDTNLDGLQITEETASSDVEQDRTIEWDRIRAATQLERRPSFSKLSSISSRASGLSKRATSVDLGMDLRNSGSNFKLPNPSNLLRKRSSKEMPPPSPTMRPPASPRGPHGRSMSSSQAAPTSASFRKEGSHSRSNSSLANLKISAPIGPVTSAIPGSPAPSTASFSQISITPSSSNSNGIPSGSGRMFSFAQGQGMLSQVWEAESERMSPSGSGEVGEESMRSISQQSSHPQGDQQLGGEPAPSSVLLDGRPFPASPLPMVTNLGSTPSEINLPVSAAMSRNPSNAESSVESLGSTVSDISAINSIGPPIPESSSSLWETKPENIFSTVLSSQPSRKFATESSESPRSGPVLVGSEKSRMEGERGIQDEGTTSSAFGINEKSRNSIGTSNSTKFHHSRGPSSSTRKQVPAPQHLEESQRSDTNEVAGRHGLGVSYEKEKTGSSTALERQSGSESPSKEVCRGSESSAHAKAASINQSQAQSLAQTYARTHSRLPSSTSSSAHKSLAKKSYNALLNLLAQGSSSPSTSANPPIPTIPVSNSMGNPTFSNFYTNPNSNSTSIPKAIESSAPSGSASGNGSGFNGGVGGTSGGGWDGSASNFQQGSYGIASFGGGGVAGGSNGSGGAGGNPNGNQSNPTSHASPAVQNIFRRLELVGRGAYGAVYRGVHVASGTAVALKVVNLDTPEDDVSDIQREVAVLSQLREADQKNVVRYWGCWLTGHELWIVMDFAEGGSIRTLVSRPSRFDVDKCQRKFVQIEVSH